MAIAAEHTRFETHEYISPIPAEDLIKVAIKKQEMYDEGRKQIKQNYDQYGKIRSTIVNESARNYFDQEMGKLMKNIQQNAGLDFANVGNVEAVINLGKPFENDEYIKTAIDNGLEVQRRYAALSALSKDERNSDNDLVFMYDAQEYIEKGGLDTKLTKNKSYPTYIDISKKMKEAEEAVKAEEFTDYGEGPRGYFEEIQVKRKRREDIYNRLMTNLTPEEQAQFQIHAQANMLRMGSDVIYQTWVGSNKEEKLVATQMRKEAMQEIARLKSVRKPTAQQIEELNKLDNIMMQTENTIAAADQNINMNPDEFDMGEYLPFFTKRFVDGMANKLAFNQTKSALKEDKVYMANYENNLALSRIKAEGQEQRRTAQFKIDTENFQVGAGVSIGSLQGINRYLGGTEVDATKTPVEQVDAIIKKIDALNPNDTKAKVKITARQKNIYLTELKQLKDFYTKASTAKAEDKISLNRSSGLGQVQTSVSDLMGRSVLDVISSGNTLELMNRVSGLGSSSKSNLDATAKAQQTLKNRVAELTEAGLTSDSATVQAKAEIRAKGSGGGADKGL